MSRDISPFGLRLPPALKVELERLAKQSGRSLNAEIVHRLASSTEEQTLRVIEKRLDDIDERIQKLYDLHYKLWVEE